MDIDISTFRICTNIIALFLIYKLFNILYRLTLHPLAKFPGPKLAAITSCYEFYYQAIKGGRFHLEISRMHRQYGPIIRVSPSELHINDPEYYDQLYNFGSQFDKKTFQIENLQHTASFELHKLRRQAMGRFFSSKEVLKLESLIKESVEKLCLRLEQGRESGEPVDVGLLYRSLTADIISEYAFSQSYGFLDNLQASKAFFDGAAMTWPLVYIVREVPMLSQLLRIMDSLPDWLMPQNAGMVAQKEWSRRTKVHVEQVMNGTIKNDAHPTIFTEIQREKLPPRDKSSKSIYENAQMLIGAGFETTGFALSVATYHVFSNTSLYHQLKAELRPVFSQPGGIPSLTELEKLPLSKAVIQESLRMSVGVMSRLQRRNTREDMQFREWVIPKRTLVAMSQPLIHYNEDIFSEPWEFNVGRWMRGKESEELERYLVPFSKGARECVAKPLAKAELYLTLATVFHRFDMNLYQTTREDVEPKRDYFVPGLERGSKGVRVLVN